MLTVIKRVEDGVGILELSGNLTLGPSLVDLRNNVRQLVEAQKLNGLILHVGALTQTDSSGLGELTVVYTLASKKRCPLRLVNVKPDLRKLLEITHLDGVLASSPDISSAKSEMKPSGAKSASSAAR